MAKQFKGEINLDIRDSTPDWEPFLADKAPEGSPNVLIILYDDTGLAAWSPFGGRIEMQNAFCAAVLRERGWNTFWVGKNHNVPVDEFDMGATEVRGQYHHCTDIVPTILDCCGVEMPDMVGGYEQTPLPGESMRYFKDVGDDIYIDLERHLQAALARD